MNIAELMTPGDQRLPIEYIDMAHQMAIYADPLETALAPVKQQLPSLYERQKELYDPVMSFIDILNEAEPGTPEEIAAVAAAHKAGNEYHRTQVWARILSRAAHYRACAGLLDYMAGVDNSHLLRGFDELAMSDRDGVLARPTDNLSPEGSARSYLRAQHGEEVDEYVTKMSFHIRTS
jgi:hypothetical protein